MSNLSKRPSQLQKIEECCVLYLWFATGNFGYVWSKLPAALIQHTLTKYVLSARIRNEDKSKNPSLYEKYHMEAMILNSWFWTS